ncbi:helix-turn-helix transcriptional regulator [uncultured Parabacteroides sp.]|jgi:transcriptional regulator with XRE-family HTH domain|uniref:helix-turn-helix domain-containing protein n=1 Tax=uncultured Parabacteroides sp. TaxID=512312 RepID=UPI0025E5AB57|nr:helix-turn-helix transcriptional regulator [uncultured Parabacteroides sp.]
MDLRIKDICREQGIMLKDLAKQLGLTEVGLSKSINGNPTIGRLEEIANALGVPVTELFDKSSDEVVGAVRIGKDTHVINSKEDIRKLAENL